MLVLTPRISRRIFQASTQFRMRRGVCRKRSGSIRVAQRCDVQVIGERLRMVSEMTLIHHAWYSIPKMLTMLGPQANIYVTVSPGQLGRQDFDVPASQRTIPSITVKSSHW